MHLLEKKKDEKDSELREREAALSKDDNAGIEDDDVKMLMLLNLSLS